MRLAWAWYLKRKIFYQPRSSGFTSSSSLSSGDIYEFGPWQPLSPRPPQSTQPPEPPKPFCPMALCFTSSSPIQNPFKPGFIPFQNLFKPGSKPVLFWLLESCDNDLQFEYPILQLSFTSSSLNNNCWIFSLCIVSRWLPGACFVSGASLRFHSFRGVRGDDGGREGPSQGHQGASLPPLHTPSVLQQQLETGKHNINDICKEEVCHQEWPLPGGKRLRRASKCRLRSGNRFSPREARCNQPEKRMEKMG